VLNTTSLDLFDWTIFGPAEASPGAPNPQPGVTVLLPLSGTILASPLANLHRYPMPEVTDYRVQLTVEDVADFPALTAELVDGRYEQEPVIDYPVPQSQGTVTVHTLIEQ
jgi:hypothetical protein